MSPPRPRNPAEVVRLARRMDRDPLGALTELHQRYGPVVDFGAGRFRYVYLFGPEANEYVLARHPERFRWRDAFLPLAPVNGDTALVVSDGEAHRRRRQVVQPAFHRRRIGASFDVMQAETHRVLDRWEPGATVDAYAALRPAVLAIVLRCLLGDDLRAIDAELAAHLETALAYVNRSPLRRFDVDLPGTAYRRTLRARRAVDALVTAVIDRRERDGSATDDVLGWLLEAGDEDDGGLSRQEVLDQVVSIVAAGYDTTAAAVGWAAHELVTHPDAWERARAEVADACGGSDGLTVDDLSRLPFVSGVVAETLRLRSPALFSGRRVVEDATVAGHTVPAGRMVLYSPAVTHRMPEHWPEPERFLPERWVPGEAAHHEVAPFAYVPFGGGPRRCLGFAFALQELTVMVAALVSRVRAEPAFDPPRRGTGIAAMAPAGGVPIRITESVRGHPVR